MARANLGQKEPFEERPRSKETGTLERSLAGRGNCTLKARGRHVPEYLKDSRKASEAGMGHKEEPGDKNKEVKRK